MILVIPLDTIITHTDVVILVIPLDTVKEIGKLSLALHSSVPIKVITIRKDPSGVQPVIVLVDREFGVHFFKVIDLRVCLRNREFQCPGLIDFHLQGHIHKPLIRAAGIIEKLPVKINQIHYRHPLLKRNVMEEAPVTETEFSYGPNTSPGTSRSSPAASS